MSNTKPVPGQLAPALEFQTQHGPWRLSDRKPDSFTLVVFYRGLHCPICKSQLRDLVKTLPEWTERGVDVVAVSMDSEDRWRKTRDEWRIDELTLGYGVSEETARAWGLYMSTGLSDKEPARFSEPGLFLVGPDGKLFFASIQSMPFTRPPLKELLAGVDYVLANDYPARGQVT